MEISILKTKLIGEQLSSVEFIQDYLQLHFDGRNFIIYVWPIVFLSGERNLFGEVNYRNALCELISYEVKDIIFIEKQVLKIVFDRGTIDIDLNSDNPGIVSEIAIFNNTINNSWSIFE